MEREIDNMKKLKLKIALVAFQIFVLLLGVIFFGSSLRFIIIYIIHSFFYIKKDIQDIKQGKKPKKEVDDKKELKKAYLICCLCLLSVFFCLIS